MFKINSRLQFEDKFVILLIKLLVFKGKIFVEPTKNVQFILYIPFIQICNITQIYTQIYHL